MAQQLKLYLFGDQTYDIQPHLRDLALHRHNAVLDGMYQLGTFIRYVPQRAVTCNGVLNSV